MRILYVVPYVPSPIRVRPYQFIRSLAACGHKVSLATLWTNETERIQAEHLKDICERVWAFPLTKGQILRNLIATLPTGNPLQSGYCWHPGLNQLLGKLTQSRGGDAGFDIVHVEHLRGARYGTQLHTSLEKARIPIAWDSVDCISLLFRKAAHQSKSPISRMIAQVELPRTERFEGQVLSQFDQVICTSSADRQALLALSGGNRRPAEINVIPNGVDLEYFQPLPDQSRNNATLVISGKMNYHANVSMVMDFVQHVLPTIWQQRPDVKLCVVGKDPPREIRRLADHPNIEVTGTIADLRPYLQKATMALAPLAYGVGIQNKVLEAMACATPVVGNRQAVSALTTVDGKDVFVANNSGDMAGLVLQLLDQPELLRRVGWAGRKYVEKHHRWGDIADSLVQVYTAAIDAFQPGDGSMLNRERKMEWI